MFLSVLALLVVTSVSASDTYCSQSYLGRKGQGVIESFNYPFDYRHNLTCVYRIYLDTESSDIKTLCFNFHRFNLEKTTPFCSYDYLKFDMILYCGSGLWNKDPSLTTNPVYTIWSNNFCWTAKGETFDILFESDNNTIGSGFYATYQVIKGAITERNPEEAPTGEVPCAASEWTCFNRKCVSSAALCDGKDDCGDGSDEAYAHARCGEQNVLSCDFSSAGGLSEDGYCGFTHEGWYRTNQRHSPYGPRGDHTNGTHGYYVYTDVKESSAYLLSPELSLTRNKTYCINFWYYVYGRPPDALLRVYINRDQAYSRPEWSRKNAPENQWLHGEVKVVIRSPLQVIFAAELDNSFSGVALDDISVLEGDCLGNDMSCNFESGTCGWSLTKSIPYRGGQLNGSLTWRIHNRLLSPVGPFADHSSRNGGGNYLYLNVSRTAEDSRGLLVSRPVSSFAGEPQCLQFWYFMNGPSRDSCELRLKVHQYNDVLSEDIWSQHGDVRNTWVQAFITMEIGRPHEIILEGLIYGGRGEIAIDEISLEARDCQSTSASACATGQYHCANGKCINNTLKCDGHVECEDLSDEDWRAGCPTPPSKITSPVPTDGPCPPFHFRCRDNKTCIVSTWVCDTFNDCRDNSDEDSYAGCTTSTSPCGANKYRCRNGRCIPYFLRCNKHDDCMDNSDEDWHANCSYVAETTTVGLVCDVKTHFACYSGTVTCIGLQYVCDGYANCMDGSDEHPGTAGCQEEDYHEPMGIGAIVGIIVGIICVIVLIFLVVVVVMRRRKKRRPARSRNNTQSTAISTIADANDLGTVRRHVNMLESMREPMQLHVSPPPYSAQNGENMAYADENIHPTNSSPNNTGTLVYPPDEPPPPYDSVVKDQMPTNRHQQHPDSSGSSTSYEPASSQSDGEAQLGPMRRNDCNRQSASRSSRRSSARSTRLPTPPRNPAATITSPANVSSPRTLNSGMPGRGGQPRPLPLSYQNMPESSYPDATSSYVPRTTPQRIRLGTQALHSRPGMYRPPNYYNDTDSVGNQSDHIYETLSLPRSHSSDSPAPPIVPPNPPDSSRPRFPRTSQPAHPGSQFPAVASAHPEYPSDYGMSDRRASGPTNWRTQNPNRNERNERRSSSGGSRYPRITNQGPPLPMPNPHPQSWRPGTDVSRPATSVDQRPNVAPRPSPFVSPYHVTNLDVHHPSPYHSRVSSGASHDSRTGLMASFDTSPHSTSNNNEPSVEVNHMNACYHPRGGSNISQESYDRSTPSFPVDIDSEDTLLPTSV